MTESRPESPILIPLRFLCFLLFKTSLFLTESTGDIVLSLFI